jgi:hypothetical protein
VKYGKIFVLSFLLCLIMGLHVYADQVLYADVAHYIPGDSQFGAEVKGNKWVEVFDPDAFGSGAFGAPGDSDYTADGGDPFLVAEPYLVVRIGEVKAGESTADGKTWVPWARMRLPADQNSFYWQVSTDSRSGWKPELITNSVRWNDDARNGSDEWYWQDHITGNDGGITADMGVGVNYVRIGARESDPVTFPTIDLVCFRNDGGTPNDDEALGSGAAVRPAEKLSTSWGHIKNTY